ncbi:MAG: tetratricopeptide repeat protein [Pseudomonadales bacterium]
MDRSEIQKRLGAGQKALKGSDFGAAVTAMAPLLNQFKADERFLRMLSTAAIKAGSSDVALRVLKHLVVLVPEDAEVNAALGDLYRNTGELEAAYGHLQKSVERAPDRPEFLYNFGLYMMDVGAPGRAESLFRAALDLRPDYAKSAFGLANALEAQSDFIGAGVVLDSMLVDRTSDPVVWFRLGRIHYRSNQPDKARDALERAQALAPKDPELVVEAAKLLITLGQVDSALGWLDQVILQVPHHGPLFKLRASLVHELGAEGCLEHYEALSFSSLTPDQKMDYLMFLVLLGRSDFAQEQLERSHGGLDNTWPNVLVLAQLQIWHDQNQFSEMISAIKRCDGDYDEWLAVAHLGLGDYGAAEQVLRRLLDTNPNNQYWIALLETALRAGDRGHDQAHFPEHPPFQIIKLQDVLGSTEVFKLNTLLEAWLMDQHRFKKSPLGQSVNQGTQTAGNLFEQNYPPLAKLWQSLKEAIEGMLQDPMHFGGAQMFGFQPKDGAVNRIRLESSWSIRVSAQGHHVPHVHSKGWLSCVYYVGVPNVMADQEADYAGYLALGRPGVTLPQSQEPTVFIKPEPGTMVVFPSYVWHETRPFTGDGERTVIAFDVLPILN